MWLHFGQITFKDSKSQLIVSSSGQFFFCSKPTIETPYQCVWDLFKVNNGDSTSLMFWWESCHQLLENSKDWSLSEFIFNKLQLTLSYFCVISRLHCRLWTLNFPLFWEHPFYRNSLCRFDIPVAFIQQCPEK